MRRYMVVDQTVDLLTRLEETRLLALKLVTTIDEALTMDWDAATRVLERAVEDARKSGLLDA